MSRYYLIMIISSIFLNRVSSLRLFRTTWVNSLAVQKRPVTTRRSDTRGRKGTSLSMWGESSDSASDYDGQTRRAKLVPDESRAYKGKMKPQERATKGSWGDFDDEDRTNSPYNKQRASADDWDNQGDLNSNGDDRSKNRRFNSAPSQSRGRDSRSFGSSNGRRVPNFTTDIRKQRADQNDNKDSWSDFDDDDKTKSPRNKQRASADDWDNQGDSNDNGEDRSKSRRFNSAPSQSRGRDGRSYGSPNGRRVPNFTTDIRKQRMEYNDGYQNNRMLRSEDAKEFRDGKDGKNKINMRALELAGYVHLYGLAPVLNALSSGHRSLKADESVVELINAEEVPPEARMEPCLFIQDRVVDGRSGDKAVAAREIEELAKSRGVNVAYVDKGILNSLCENRPHQGYVLRCGKFSFEPLSRIPKATDGTNHNLWLVLDEVVDPQNFGALLRTAYFLGGCVNGQQSAGIGVLICEKNSAPPSPVVSAASAGALELSRVYSTTNLPRTLNAAKDDGWRIIGAAASVESGADEPKDLYNLSPVGDTPTLLVLGSEGQGLRTLVARTCTEFVRIPGIIPFHGENDISSRVGVDSLNVSVSGAMILWHLLHGKM